jgi:hypothetical protein
MSSTNGNSGTKTLNRLLLVTIGISLVILLFGGLLMLSPTMMERVRGLFGAAEFPLVEFETLAPEESKDHFLLCPAGLCLEDAPDRTSPEFTATASELQRRLIAYVDSRPEIRLRDMNLAERQFYFVEQTGSMRFPDIIVVRLIDLDINLATLAIYSLSPFDNDLPGANQRRVERWLQNIEAIG